MKKIGAYVYGIVPSAETISLGEIGLEKEHVVTVPSGNLAAAVHWCDPTAYDPGGPKVVEQWLLAHQAVVDQVWNRFGNVLPVHFGMIVTGLNRKDVIQKLLGWIEDERNAFTKNLKRLEGLKEYGVQIFWERENLRKAVIQGDPGLSKKEQELTGLGPGTAYLKRRALEVRIRELVERRLDEEGESLMERIRSCVGEISLLDRKPPRDGQMMLTNLSCLAGEDQVTKLGELLEEIGAKEGRSVRFTGPWPPYSFVGL